jgi:hypothetical protein
MRTRRAAEAEAGDGEGGGASGAARPWPWPRPWPTHLKDKYMCKAPRVRGREQLQGAEAGEQEL